LRLNTLGRLELLPSDAPGATPVAAQPKRLALLAYLALATPRGLQRRDVLLGLFWPDLDQEEARRALRQALHHLRHFLNDGVLVSRADEVVGIADGSLWSDAIALEGALAAGRATQALELYRGDFLEGFFVSEVSAEFEQWVDRTRAGLRRRAAEAANALAEQEAKGGNAVAAILAARRAVELAPDDEPAVRRLIGLHCRLGDHAGALRTYDEFARRLADEFGAAPSSDTVAVLEKIRASPAPAEVTPILPFAEPEPFLRPPMIAGDQGKASPHPATAPASFLRRTRPTLMAGAALLLAVAGGALWQQHHVRALSTLARATTGFTRLAVLPFENLGDSEDAYFTDGVCDAVRDKLASIPGLEVVASTSSDKYRNTAKRPEEIGRELGVRYLLIGKVRWEKTAGGVSRVQVRPELVEAATGAERWAEAFETRLSDVFQVQADVGARVAQALGLALGTGGRERLAQWPTRDLAAYDLYLQGRAFWNQRTPNSLQTAARYFERAVRQDPTFAHAYAGLAEVYELFPDYGIGPPSEAHPKAKAAALQALALDSTLAEAHVVLADVREFYDWNWPGAEREFRHAIALDPSNAIAHHWYADYLVVVGRLDEALTETERAHTLDPLSRSISSDKGNILYYSRRYDEAIGQLRRTLELDPDFAVAHDVLGSVFVAEGRLPEAVAELKTAVRLTGSINYTADLAFAYAVSGQRDRALALVRELTERSRREYVSPAVFAIAYTGLGDRTRAFAALERAFNMRDHVLLTLANEPFFDDLRSDPRFTQLLKRLGLKS
jgi:DNA-binding SARP family transcriptional activator/TolB-like protein/Tfp pilus assembly protein PilF